MCIHIYIYVYIEPFGEATILQLRNVVMFNTAISLSQGWRLALLVTHSMRDWPAWPSGQMMADDQDPGSIFG